jgi:hypothetical protein
MVTLQFVFLSTIPRMHRHKITEYIRYEQILWNKTKKNIKIPLLSKYNYSLP